MKRWIAGRRLCLVPFLLLAFAAAPEAAAQTLSIDSPSVTEGDSGSTTLTFTVTLNPFSTGQVTVSLADAGTGTATSGTDYTTIAGTTLIFLAGTTSQTFNVSVTGDTTDEANETVIMTLSNPTNATISSGTGTGTITDDDGPTVSINSPSVTEGDSGSTNLTFTATLSAASVQQVTVDYADAGTGTATSGTDYTAITGGTLTFPAGTTSQTFNVSVTGDTTDEANETVVVTLSSPTNATISSGTGTGTITDDDGPTVSIDSPSVTEGDSGSTNLTFTATLSAASVQQVTVDYADAGTGTATSGTDYTAITGGTLTFPAGTTSQTFNVAVTGDTTDEADETVVVTLSSPTNATISSGTGTGTITDDDGPTVSIDSPSVTEGDSGSTNLTFTATLSAASAQQVTVDYADAGTGTATSGTDYTAITGGTLTFPAGTTSQTFNVAVTGDTTDEADETIVVTLSSPTNATIATGTGTGTITDDDGPTVSVNSPSVTEGDSGSTNLTFTATLSAASVQQVTVDWGPGTGGTATSGTDYTAITGGTLTFPAGTTSQTFNVAVTGDTTDEADETVVVTLSSPTNATIATGTGTGTITDDDGPTVSIDSPTVTEGDSGSTNLTFTVTLSAASVRQVTVDYADAETGTATSGTDYTAITDATLTFTAGTTSQTFTVAVTGDTTDEADETVVVTLSSPTNATIAAGTGTGTITDDDGPTVSIDSPSVTEGDSGSTNLTFTATLSAASVQQVTVDYADAGTGTATSGTDYTAITGGTLTFPAGTTSQTFNVAVTGDTTDEADETVVVTLSSPTNATISTANGTGTITDDDGPTVSIDSPSVTEGDSGSTNLTFTATLSAASAQQVTVDYTDAGTGTATSGTDYTAITGGTLTFPVGTTSQTFNVVVTGDTTDEANETVVVTLSSPTNATISTASGTGTITNDDGPTVSIDSPSVTEGDGGSTNLTFTVTLSPASAQQVTVDYTDAGTGTATSGTDYTAITDATLTFTAGTTSQTFTVAVTGDTTDETDETIVVTLSSSTNATIATGTGTGTITDDDGPTVSVNSPSVTEGDSGSTNLTFTATLSATSVQQVTVDYADATTGTATSGTDYTAITGSTLTFAVGATSQTFNVSVTGDTTDEVDETVVVTLSSPTNATVSSTAGTGTGTITDDDGPTVSVNSPSVTEGDSGSTNLTFTVTLSAASVQPVTVAYADATTGTATAGTDYTAITAGTLTFATGTTSQTFNVSVTGDTTDEADETVVVTLSSATNATISTATGTGTITNDDVTPGARWTPGGVWTHDVTTTSLIGKLMLQQSVTITGGSRIWDNAAIDACPWTTVTPPLPSTSCQSLKSYGAIPGSPFRNGPLTVTNFAPTQAMIDNGGVVVRLRWQGYNSPAGGNVGMTEWVPLVPPPSATLVLTPPSISENAGVSTVTATLDRTTSAAVTITVSAAAVAPAVSGDFTLTGTTLTIPAGTTTSTGTVTLTAVDNAIDAADKAVTVSGTASDSVTNAPPDVTLTITDDETPTLSIDSPTVTEGDSGSVDMTFTVSLSPASAQQVTVDWADAGTGTATSGTDYAAITGGTLTFPAGTTSQTITVSVTGDTAAEPNETVAVSLSNPANATIGTGTGTGTITDDDGAAPTLSIDSPRVAEGDDGATDMTFTVTLSPASTQQVTVDWADAGSGTATSGTDYAAVAGGTLTFPAGTTSQTITVSVTGDTAAEPNETVAVSLSNPANATIGTGTGTGTIADDDGGIGAPSLSIDSPRVAEGDSGATDMTFTVTLSPASAQQVKVDWADAGTGTATSGTDYAAVAGGTLTFAAWETSKSFTVSVTGDTLDEEDETVVASLSNAGNATVSTATGTGTIVDDDGAPSLSIDSPRVAEGDGGATDMTFTVTLSAASGKQVTVDWADAGSGTATSGTDYAAVAGGTLTFAAGETSKSFAVSVTGDVLDEADETVVASLSNAGNATVSTATGTGTIVDDDGAPSLSIDSPRVAEGDGGATDMTFTVTLSPASAQQVKVDWADAGTGTATSGTDYAAVAGGTLTFAAGETSKSFAVSVTGDVLDEADETVVASLSNAGNATVSTATGTGTIVDDDAPPTLSIDSPSVAEGDGGATDMTFTVTLSPASAQQVKVDWADAGSGTATSGTDYAAVAGGTLTFAAGETSKSFAVSVTGDVLDEADETVVASLSNAGNATVSTATGTGTIVDDDAPPTLSIDSPSVAEGDGGATDMTFTVTLSAASGKQVTVDWADAGSGTATSGTDYAAVAGGTLTFAAGETSKSFAVSVTGDVLDEADETVVASLSNAGNATVSTATGTGTIVDDDAPPTLSIDSPSVAEGDGGATDMTFTVTLSAASGKQVTVDWADAGSGTATSGTDYAAVAGGTLTFAAGETSKSFAVSVTGDVLDEADETVVASLSNAGNATVSTATGTGTIVDDDAPPTLSIDSPSVAEGDGGATDMTFTVTLSAASGKQVTVDWADAGSGTATSGTDYAAVAGGTLTFAAGETSKSFTVSVTGDVLAEADETVVAVLSRPANAVLGTARGVGTIIDDDMDLTPSFGGAAVPDQSWIQNWPIPALTLPAATGGNGALTYALAPALPAGLSFDAATRELSGTPTRARAASEHTLTATDGDGDAVALSFSVEVTGPVAVSIADGRAVEGGPAEFGVTLSKPVPEGGSLLVVWRTVDGTAVAESDYAPPAGGRGELTIAAGQDAAAIAVQTVDDGVAEGEEAFTVRLVSAGHAELGDAEAAGRIVDDDLARLRGEALQWSLAAFGRTVATEAVDAIGQRFRPGGAAPAAAAPWAGELDALGAPPLAGGGAAGAFGAPGAGRGLPPGGSAAAGLPGGAAGAERSPLGEFLSQVAFESRLGANGEDAGDGGRWTLWGRGSRSRFSSGSGAGLSLDGKVDTGYLGADARLSEGGPLLGVALSHSVGELGYRESAAGLEGGRVDVDLSSALPYGHWSVSERASLWALLGVGWGKAVLTDRFGRSESDTSMRMAALGGRGELAPWRGLALALKGDAFAVSMEGSPTLGGAASMPDVDADARRLRVMVEGRRGWQPSARQSLELSLEFGGRWDGGDADAGMGAELGGGLAYRHAAWGLGVEARGRRLLGHAESAFEEWGASVSVALDPGEEGVGASLSLSPVWGEASSGVEGLWRSERLLGARLGGQAERAGRGGWRPGRLRMELGYGFETRGPSLLRLYGGLEEDGPGSRSWRLGGGMTGGRLDWSLELDRRERWGEPPEHGVLLRFGNGFVGAAPAAPPLQGR